MAALLFFIFGMVFGSFGYVLALRYDGEHFLLDPKVVGGRSYCPHCKKTLQWYELIPFVSFAIQGGRCRGCGARIGFIYPLMELFTGFLFVFIAARVQDFYGIAGAPFFALSALWIAFFFALLILSVIDIRLGIIPDEIVVFLVLCAAGIVGYSATIFGTLNSSFLGPYASMLGLQGNIWTNRLAGGLIGILFFGGLVAGTRGRGMGIGDVKLALPLGLLFGWPDMLFLSALSFIIGAAIGIISIWCGKKTIKSSLPFGPFLAVSALAVFFCGSGFMTWYFHAMGL
jgi:leader peptidase (prepilin peptidase)/N-methyltransferase